MMPREPLICFWCATDCWCESRGRRLIRATCYARCYAMLRYFSRSAAPSRLYCAFDCRAAFRADAMLLPSAFTAPLRPFPASLYLSTLHRCADDWRCRDAILMVPFYNVIYFALPPTFELIAHYGCRAPMRRRLRVPDWYAFILYCISCRY